MAKKVILKDNDNIEILPITRGELITDSSGNPAFHSILFLATDSLPGLMSAEDKAKLDDLEEVTVEDKKVELVNTTTNDSYRLLFSSTADDTTRTEGARKSANLLFNPSTGALTAPIFNGKLDWSNINNKPDAFTPEQHTHTTNEIVGLLGYTKAEAPEDLVTTDTLNVALGKLEYKADTLYTWYRSITDEDTDVYINKWLEIVDFLNNVLSGTNILDEFVTRKTPQEIIGAKTFTLPITSSVTLGTAPFIITSPTLVTNLNSDLWDGKHLYKSFDDSENIDSSALLWGSNGVSTGLASMLYAMVLNVNASDKYGRRWQIWNSRHNHQLYWRPELPDMSGYAPEHILLDSLNYKGFIELMYWANIPILSISDSNTSPIFLNAATTGMLQTNLIRDLAGNWLLDLDPETANLNIGTSAKNHYIALLTTTADNEVFINDLGNTGIGTKTPAAKLHVVGTTYINKHLAVGTLLNPLNSSRASIDLITSGANPTDLWLGADGTRYWSITARNSADTTSIEGKGLGFYDMVNATYRMFITQSGKVGISTTNPSHKLHVAGNAMFNGTIYTNTNYNNYDTVYNIHHTSIKSLASDLPDGHNITMGIGKANSNNNVGYFSYHHVGDGSTSNYIRIGLYGADDILNIVATKNVGIGITTPSTKLDVEGDGKIYGNLKVGKHCSVRPTVSTLGNSQLAIGNYHDKGRTTFAYGTAIWTEGSGKGFIQLGRGDGIAETYPLILLLFGGNVGIRTDSPSYPLHVIGDSYTTGWSRADNGFYIEGTGVHYMSNGIVGLIYTSTNNEFIWSASNASLYFNYRAASAGTTVTNYIWHAGSSNSYANHTMGTVNGVNFVSRAETGTLPYACTSTTLNTNLNADLWDGRHFSVYFTKASDINWSYLMWIANGACSDVSAMNYAAVMNVGTGLYRGWLIWNSRNDHKLYWRPVKLDASGWADVHVLLDSHNYTSYTDSRYVNVTGDTMTNTLTIGQKVSSKKATWLKLTTPGHTGSAAWCVGVDDTSANSYVYFKYNESDTSYFYIRHDGCIFAPHFYESSDQRLKENIQAILNKDNIPQIKEFDWKESGEHSYGLIAQELEEQGYSELVSTKDDGSKTVNYSAALSLIVGKLQVKIKELEKEIENLKNKN